MHLLPGQRSVFVSATTTGFGLWRRRVSDILTAHGLTPIEQNASVPGSEKLAQDIGNSIYNADGVICLIGPYYGQASPKVRDGYRLSYTQYEWRLAHELPRPCLTFIAGEQFFGGGKIVSADTPEETTCQQEFIRFVREQGGRGYRDVQMEVELALELAKVNWDRWPVSERDL